MSRAGWVTLVVLALLVALPEAAHACPVCFDSRDENRIAFFTTALLLTFLPLDMVGGVGIWVRRRLKRMELEGDVPDEDVHRV